MPSGTVLEYLRRILDAYSAGDRATAVEQYERVLPLMRQAGLRAAPVSLAA